MRCVTFIKISYNVTNLMLKISRIPVYSVFALDSFHCIIKCSGLSQYIKVNTPGLNRSVKCLFCHQSCHIQSHIFNIYLPGFVNDWTTNCAKRVTLYICLEFRSLLIVYYHEPSEDLVYDWTVLWMVQLYCSWFYWWGKPKHHRKPLKKPSERVFWH